MTTKEEQVFNELIRHYEMATEDLDVRIPFFDTADELFRSYLDEDSWPYSALIFAPRIFTTIFEKTSRLIGTKPRGRLVPREGGDVLGAKINNEILSFEWDEAARVDGEPLIAKWAMMDMNARKYGAAFALCKWHYERKIQNENGKYLSKPYFDGPSFQVLNNRDVLLNPSYPTIKNWFQYREYLTLRELEAVNDVARGKPIYKNLDELKDKVKADMKTIDKRESNYQSRNKSIKGLQDFLGRDETNKVIEIVTEYQDNKWLTFAPKHGIVIRDVDNPYKHKQIPAVMLKYYPIDDDIYGLSEIEPVEKLQKALNAIVCQYMDAVNMELYPVFGVDSTRVRMHTLQFSPRAKWIVTGDPRTAISRMDFSAPNSIGQFRTTYQMLIGEMQEALGESSQMQSTLNPFEGKKTATEIKDTAGQRLARDNFNQIFLAEAIKRQMMLWFSMNQQFFFNAGEKQKIIRIVGKDAIDYFQEAGLDSTNALTDEAIDAISQAQINGLQVNPTDYGVPLYPVVTNMGIEPKMKVQGQGEMADITLEPDDLQGNYDYIADIESMQPPNNQEVLMAKKAALEAIQNPQLLQGLMNEGKQVKVQELLEDYLEQLGFKDASKYFEDIKNSPMVNGQTNQTLPAGAEGTPTIPMGAGNGQMQGMGAVQGIPQGQNQQQLAGPPIM